jgi:regulation of enolase protein 1 (concanavalin A-like superfamily)
MRRMMPIDRAQRSAGAGRVIAVVCARMRRMSDPVSIAPLPAPLAWDVAPASFSVDEGPLLTITAPPRSDLFVDPAGAEPTAGAPRLLGPVAGDFQLSARVRSTFAGTFDAGALLLWAGERTWAKLAFEVSPQREAMVVSVITDGRASDDANAFVVEDEAVWLRISRRGSACALHARLERDDGWRFVRHFALDAPGEVRVGFLAQSPMAEGATARFDQIGFVANGVADLRSGE